MEALTVLRLNVLPRRNNAVHGYPENDEGIHLPSPNTSAPSSPRRAFAKEAEEAPLGEIRAAVPFVWELIPGTLKNSIEISGPVDVASASSDGTEETGCQDHGSSSSSDGSETTETLSWEPSNAEFKFCNRFVGIVEPPPSSPALPMSTAEDLFSNGKLLPLRLPPRLQAVKYLRNSVSSCSDVSSSGSFKSYHSLAQSPRSLRRALNSGPKVISVLGFTTSAEEATILGMPKPKQRQRSLSPLQFFNREGSTAGSNLSSETYFSNDSVSSVSSSSSSAGDQTNVDSPRTSWNSSEEKNHKGSTLKDLLFTDMAMASSNKVVEQDRAIKPRKVDMAKIEKLKEQEQWNGLANVDQIDRSHEKPALNLQLSRSNVARSRATPIEIIRVKSIKKEQVGRALLANRFGMLCSCLGKLPESP